MAPVAKRRIQPQLISPPQGQAAARSIPATYTGVQSHTPAQALHFDRPGQSEAPQEKIPEPKQDSEAAARLGMKGRRIYVPLTALSQEVNYKKLLKAQGIPNPGQPLPNIAEPTLPGLPGAQKPSKSAMPLAGVIARLERQYVLRDEDESSQECGSQGQSLDQPEHSGDESGAEKGDAENIGEYYMEDDFIDDDEFANFIEGDRRKSKFQGFFINKGEIEKAEEKDLPDKDSPKAKKKPTKRAALENGVEKDKTQPEAKKAKKQKLESPAKASKEAKAGKAQPPIPEPLDSAAQDLSSIAVLAGKTASKANGLQMPGPAAAMQQPPAAVQMQGLPALNLPPQPAQQESALQSQGQQAYVPSKEMDAALQALQEHVEPAKKEEAQNPSTAKTIPKRLNPHLSPLACLLDREGAAHPAAREQVLDKVASMFEPLYSLSKIAKRLESLSKAANDELAATLSRIRDHIITRMETIKVRQEHQQSPLVAPLPEGYLWDKHIEHNILTYRNTFRKIHGPHIDDEAIMETLLPFWPQGQMSVHQLLGALTRAIENASNRSRAARKPQDGIEIVASDRNQSADLPAAADSNATRPKSAAVCTAPAAIPSSLPQNGEQTGAAEQAAQASPGVKIGDRIEGVSAQPSDVEIRPSSADLFPQIAQQSQSPNQEGQMAEPASDESLLKVAMHLGADAKVLVESIQEAKNLRTNIVTMVLMCAGARGYTAQELVDRANALGLTTKDGGPWDRNMRRTAASVIRNSKHLVNIGSSTYAHVAFAGVKEKAAIEAEKKKLKADSVASRATGGASRNPSVDPEAA